MDYFYIGIDDTDSPDGMCTTYLLEEIRDSMDNEGEFKASFFDLEKDVSDFQDDTEKRNKYSHEFDEDYLDDITSARGLDISVDEAMMLHESRGPYSANFSQDEIENFYNPPEIRIGGERINGQSSDLSIIIEFRDGKPVLKNYTNKKKYKYDDKDEFWELILFENFWFF